MGGASREKRTNAVIASIYVGGRRVGDEVKGVVAGHQVAHIEFIDVDVVAVRGPAAVLVCVKAQGYRAALIECVVVLALRGSSSFSDNGDLILGTRLGR